MPERDHEQVPLTERIVVLAGKPGIVFATISSAKGLQNGHVMGGSITGPQDLKKQRSRFIALEIGRENLTPNLPYRTDYKA